MSAAASEHVERVLSLSEILGQDHVVAMLGQALARKTLHHALLFVGPEGVGKRSAAIALAARLLCSGGPRRPAEAARRASRWRREPHPDLPPRDPASRRQRSAARTDADRASAGRAALPRRASARRRQQDRHLRGSAGAHRGCAERAPEDPRGAAARLDSSCSSATTARACCRRSGRAASESRLRRSRAPRSR